MDLTPYITSLRDDLTAAAAVGDEHTRRAAAALSAALEPAARLAIMNALSDLAAEVTASLPDHVVDVRLDGRDVRVVVSGEARSGPQEAPPPPPPPHEGGEMSRMTLRLFEELKAKAEQAASAQGMSLNTFVQQAVQGAVQGALQGKGWSAGGGWQGGSRERGSRVQGWYEG
ncbi:toxin-antitoxin system HicB family antitoxin [Actinokineospora sp. NPDC004072]